MSFPRYPGYKDSGAEWCGEIPETWTPTRLRFLLQDGYAGLKIGPFGSQLTSDMLEDEGAYKVYGQENIIANDFVRGNRYIGGEKFRELSVYEINPGDLLITMMGTSGRCDVAPSDIAHGIMDSHLLRMRVTAAALPDFVRLLIDEAAYVGTQIQLAGKGSIMHGLNSSIVKNLLLFVPPIKEQAQILAFLDRETAKIDELVAEQRRLMELLKEKRQAVISHAVTQGPNPHAPRKPSGIEWLGDVPAHWEVTPLKYVVNLRSGGTPSKTNLGYWDGDVPWASSKDLKVEVLADTQDHITQRAVDDGAAELVAAGSLLIVVRGMILIHTFPVVKTLVPMAINQDLKALAPSSKLNVDFLAWLLRGASRETLGRIDEAAHGTKVLRIEAWTSIALPIPPIDEQLEIVRAILDDLSQLDALTSEAQRAIDLLQERRTALISAAVTGQIDLRALNERKAA